MVACLIQLSAGEVARLQALYISHLGKILHCAPGICGAPVGVFWSERVLILEYAVYIIRQVGQGCGWIKWKIRRAGGDTVTSLGMYLCQSHAPNAAREKNHCPKLG